MPTTYDVFLASGSSSQDRRWGQILTLPSSVAIVEVFRAFGGAKEEGLRTLTRLNRLFDQFPLSLSDILVGVKQFENSDIASLLIFSFAESACSLVIQGKGKIFIRRGRTFSPLLQREGSITGEIQTNDILLFLSETAVEILQNEEANLFSENLTAKEMADTLSIRLSQVGAKGEGATAAIVAFRTIEVKKVIPTYKQTPLQRQRARVSNIFSNLRLLFQTKKNKWYGIFFILTLLFLVSVVLGVRKQQGDTSYQKMMASFQSAKNLYDEGVSLIDSQSIKSREDFIKAQILLDPYLQHPPKGKEAKSIETLGQQIHDNLQLVSKVFEKDPQLFFDASFLQKDRVISQFSVGDQFIAIADTQHGTIGVVDILSKDAAVITGGGEYMSTKSMVWNGQELLIVKDGGVMALDPATKTPKQVITSSDTWDAIATFGTNFYAANRSENTIWRYPAKDTGFGDKETYFSDDSVVDISKTTGMVIDGSIWFGSTIGKIFRYTQGRDDPFLTRGIDPALGQHLEVSTNPDVTQLYVFDPENNRVVVLSKEGLYLAQYVWPKSFTATAFGVSFTKQKIFLLSNQKLYSLSVQ